MATYPNVNAANQYARDVVNGKILACRLTILACQRHLDDLERAKDPRWPYRFDKNKAERFLRFSQKMPHTSGEWARRKLRIEFEPWQKFALGVPFGWVRKDTGFRRFTEIYIEVPRKNGKSAIAAAVGNYMFCADGEYAAEVYCGATTEKQAWKVFAPALAMVKKLPALRQKFSIKPWAKKMTRPDGSLFAPVTGSGPGWISAYLSAKFPTKDDVSVALAGKPGRQYITQVGVYNNDKSKPFMLHDDNSGIFLATLGMLPTAGLGGNGWHKDNATGLITQWGSGTIVNNYVAFPVSFPNICASVQVTDAGNGRAVYSASSSTTGMTVYTSGSNPVYSWLAIGY